MSDLEVEEEPGLEAFLPTGFGKQQRKTNTATQVELAKRKVNERINGSSQTGNVHDRSSDSDEDDGGSSDDEDEFPTSHELLIKTHEKAVTTATLDPSGARLITGSNDCTLKLHDFSSMTPTTVRAFRSVDPTAQKGSANVETHPVYQATYNPISPSQVLVVAAMPQAKVFNRDGEQLVTFVKGDMYLRDMHNTKGHVSEVTSGAWHPTSSELCVTAGTDSTLRIWDVNNPRSQKEVIVHKSKSAGSAGRTRMTAVSWGSPTQGGNNLLVGAAFDGSLAMWSGEGPYNRPTGEIRDAHVPSTWTSGVDISSDGRLVVTRGGDDTIKTWDTRKFKSPVATLSHASTSSQYPTSNIRFSPNSASIITGSETGHLHILNPATLKAELITPVTPGSPLITALWHSKLNQIITSSANAEVHVLYSPNISTGGAKAVMLKAPKRRHIDDDPNLTMDLSHGVSGDTAGQPTTSFAARHPTVGMTASGRSRDPRRPHVPASTPFAKTQPDEQHIKESIPLSSMRDEDPREALLKYADKAAKEPMFTNAWSKTQPKTIYADLSDNEQEPDAKRAKR
ncbi:MAG: hypothetical protein M1828_006370 [Chrysothrix sp. TS-e1954]|nr:MAG: hypothetical protein M1828_006370 [Chrysothrix sp. TS-e1954]